MMPPHLHGVIQGQNEMLSDWLAEWADKYLQQLYDAHRPPQPDAICACGSTLKGTYSCDDCLESLHWCKSCLVGRHLSNPCHRILTWTGEAWSRVSLASLGLVISLGDHTEPCKLSFPRSFILGDINGLHNVTICVCRCGSAPAIPIQFMQRKIFPCSDDYPSSGFTFRVLRQYHLASTDAKISTSRFFSVMKRQTNNTLPHLSPNRFREFARCTRQWMHLQDLKRAGETTSKAATGMVSQVATSGPSQVATIISLALRCPGCPRLNINYQTSDVMETER